MSTLAASRTAAALRRSRRSLLQTTALHAVAIIVAAAPAHAQPAPSARPQGGTVVAGSASIARSPTTTTINQTSPRAAVNWQSFNVGSAQTVDFNQPSASAIILNRVTGPDPSQIAGHINANGQVVLVNQSGVIFTRGAQVNAQGLIVSSADISNPNFMSGSMKFDRPGNPNASITNQGTITIKQRGLAALVAPAVANAGVIRAPLGTVVLAGAQTQTVDLYGDGLMSIDVSKSVTQVPVGPNGKKVTALVNNTGTILADGGTVVLTAAAADGIVQNLVTTSGKIVANTARNGQTGTIALHGVGGSLLIEGDISAAGAAPGTTGGSIELTATKAVTVAAGARITASGKSGGGTVAVGTTLARARGGAAVTGAATAATTTVAAGAKITADAIQRGNGGNVTVLSTMNTTVAGAVRARGGKTAGNGGTVEISGATGLAFTGTANVSAPAGELGTVLFDPGSLVIGDASPATAASLSPTVLAADVTGDIVVSTTGDLTVLSPINLTAAGQSITITSGSTLIVQQGDPLSAPGDIVLTAGASAASAGLLIFSSVTSTGGAVSLTSGTAGAIVVDAPVSGASAVTITAGTGGLMFSGVGSATGTATGAAVTLTSAGTIGLGGTVSTSGRLGLSAVGDIVATGALNAGTLTGGSSMGGAMLSGTNAIATLSDFSTKTNLTVLDGRDLTVTGTVSSSTGAATIGVGGASLSVPGAVTAMEAVNLTGGTVNIQGVVSGSAVTVAASSGTLGLSGALTSTGLVSLTASADINATGAINAGTLIGASATGQALFTGPNAIATLSDFNTFSDFRLANTQSLSVTGSVASAAGNVAIDAGFAPLQIQGAVSAPVTVSLNASSLDVSGAITAGTVALTTAGDINETGSVTAGTLTGGSAGGQASLLGINDIATLSGFTTQADLRLLDARSLVVGGAVASRTSNVALGTGVAGLTVQGSLTAPQTISLSGGSVDIPGSVAASTVSIAAAAGTIGLAGTVSGNSVGLSASGDINETGTLTAATLTGASASGGAMLTGINDIAALSDFTTQADFRFADTRALTIAGHLASAAGTIAINTAAQPLTVTGAVTTPLTLALQSGSLDLPGSISGGTVELTAPYGITESGALNAGTLTGASTGGQAMLTGTNAVAMLGDFTTLQDFRLNDATNLSVAGKLSSIAGAIVIDTGAYALAIPGSVSTPSLVTLSGADIDVTGSVSGAAVSMTATSGSVGIAGEIATQGAFNVSASGDVTEVGTLTASLLTGSAGGYADFSGAAATSNRVANLGNFSAPISLTLLDGADLQLSSATISATTIRLSAASLAISGTTWLFTSGPGFVRPSVGTAPQDPFTAATNAGFAGSVGTYAYAGAYLTSAQSFAQSGVLGITSSSGVAPLLSISLVGSAAGTVLFDPSPIAGLAAPSAALLLHLGTGSASGTVNINTLQLFYSSESALPTTIGGTLRTAAGTIADGPFAASQAGIGQQDTAGGPVKFAPDNKYQINGCEIAAVNCVNIVRLLPPVLDPLKDIKLGIIRDTDDETILLLPDITDLSY